jgi:hypothetical protein
MPVRCPVNLAKIIVVTGIVGSVPIPRARHRCQIERRGVLRSQTGRRMSNGATQLAPAPGIRIIAKQLPNTINRRGEGLRASSSRAELG